MKEFWVYTGLRIALFLASLAIVVSVWILVAGRASAGLSVIIAFAMSGVGSYFLLASQREAFALRVQERAERATARFEEMRSREDVD